MWFNKQTKPNPKIETNIQTQPTIAPISLAKAAQQSGLLKKQVDKLAHIFQWEIDFEQEVHPRNQFRIIMGKNKQQDILAVELSTQNKTYRAIRYMGDYYTPKGVQLQKISILSAPVKFTTISSPFGTRTHPISKNTRFHKGIDYAAPSGTPIIAAGDATVKFVGRQRGYGKVVILEHHKQLVSLYAHMSQHAKGLRVGNTVIQGKIIGYVGHSGSATGNHLHYELKLDGVPLNPQSVILPISVSIPQKRKEHFLNTIKKVLTQLDILSQRTHTKLVQIAPLLP